MGSGPKREDKKAELDAFRDAFTSAVESAHDPLLPKRTPGRTQGTWSIQATDVSWLVKSSNDVTIAILRDRTNPNAMNDAAAIVSAVNAHQDMLSALKVLLEAVHDGPERILREDEIEAIIKARTAIAKAEGK